MTRPSKLKSAFGRQRANDRRLSTFCIFNLKELEAELGNGRRDWKRALLVFSEIGLTDDYGQPLTAETAARTLRRAKARVTAWEAGRTESSALAPLLPGEVARGVRTLPSPTASVLHSENRPGRATPADPAAVAPPSPGPTISGPLDGPVGDGATEAIRRALERIGADRMPMPKRT